MKQSNDLFIDWKTIFSLVIRHNRNLIIAHTLAILAAASLLPIPLLLPLMVDEVILNKPDFIVETLQSLFPVDWHGPVLYILAILIFTIVLRILGLIFTIIQSHHFTVIAKEVVFKLRQKLLTHLQRISLVEYETLGNGSITSLLVTDLNVIDEFIAESISKTLISVLTLIGVSVILIWMQWQLALFIILFNPIVIYFTVVLGKRVKKLKTRENSAFSIFQETLTETLEFIQQVRATNREKHYLSRVIDNARKIQHHATQFSWKTEAANRSSMALYLIAFDIFRAGSMLMVIFSDLTLGEMMAVFGYLWFMLTPVQELLNLQFIYHASDAALKRINNLVNMELEPVHPNRQDPFTQTNSVSIQLKNINFYYQQDKPILNNLSLNIKQGEKVAIVGASGSGKTTLVHILLGLYPIKSGYILFNQVPVTEIGFHTVRNNISTVLQHPAMFNDSIRNNLTLGLKKDDSDLWQALKIAQIFDLVTTMPEQLDTIIGKQGVRLSGGQQQRLAIARMIINNPKVVILDEASSAIDRVTEIELHQELANYLKGRTTIIIAHRLNTVKDADRIYVMEHGRFIEQGTHEQLITQEGLYQQLY